jgi:Reverse transcriptase (RNA-dependent DNA polymerase)
MRAIAHDDIATPIMVDDGQHGSSHPIQPAIETARTVITTGDTSSENAPAIGADATPEIETSVRRWSRRHKPTRRLIESLEQERANVTNQRAYQAIKQNIPPIDGNDYDDDVYHGTEEYEIQRQMADPIAFAASSDPDIMYLHEAMTQPDKREFVKAMVDEVTTHTERGHWKVIPIKDVPTGTKILPAVWAMRRKRKILSREVYKWKARLNVHGGKQTKGVDYWETYAAALKWSSIRFFLVQTLINGWHTRQLDFVLAYPQADVECDLYLEIPQGFEFEGSRKTHCLKLIKNLYIRRSNMLTMSLYVNDFAKSDTYVAE